MSSETRCEEISKAPALPAYPTESGWYCIVFLDEDNRPNYGPIFKLDIIDDEHVWTDEDGDEVEHLFDTFLQVRVAMDAADGYVRQ